MITNDAELLKTIRDYMLFLRTRGVRVSLSCVDERLRVLYPAFGELEIHSCALCDLMKSNAATARACFSNKNRLVARKLRENTYNCCPYAIEEFLIPVIYESEPIAYLHAAGYAGKNKKTQKLYMYQRQRLLAKMPALGISYEKEYALLCRDVPSESEISAALTPLGFMLKEFYENFIAGRSVSDHYDILNARILKFVYDNYPLPISPETMAQRLNYSLPHIRYVFQLKNGVPLAKFITICRLKQAAAKLKNSECTVAEAALSSGFADANHFSVLFKKQYGVSPSAWKKCNF